MSSIEYCGFSEGTVSRRKLRHFVQKNRKWKQTGGIQSYLSIREDSNKCKVFLVQRSKVVLSEWISYSVYEFKIGCYTTKKWNQWKINHRRITFIHKPWFIERFSFVAQIEITVLQHDFFGSLANISFCLRNIRKKATLKVNISIFTYLEKRNEKKLLQKI